MKHRGVTDSQCSIHRPPSWRCRLSPGRGPCPSWWPLQGSGMFPRWPASRVCPPAPPSGPLPPRGCAHQVAACPGGDGWVAGQGSRWASGGQGFWAQRPAPCSRGPGSMGPVRQGHPIRAPCCDRSSFWNQHFPSSLQNRPRPLL